jgi:PAS domain S-box-containing protein
MQEATTANSDRQRRPDADFEAIFREAPNPYVLLDTGLRIVDMNAAYLRATNSERDRIVGRYIFDAFPDGDDSPNSGGIEMVRQSLLKVIEERRPDHLALVEYSIEGQDGYDRRYWSATHVPIFGSGGEVAFVLQNTVDVTELTKLRAESALHG